MKKNILGEDIGEHLRHLHISDNIKVLRKMTSNSVDLIYLDPPFNSKRFYFAPAESKSTGAQFNDTWKLGDIHLDEAHELQHHCPKAYEVIESLHAVNGDSWKAYLIFMGVRLIEMQRVLKSTGSIYLHCDPTMSHSLKIIMDCIFGISRFRNELLWNYAKIGVASNKWTANTDTLLFYTKSDVYNFNVQVLDRPNEIHTRFQKLVRNNKLYYRELKTRNDSITRSKCRVAAKKLGRALVDDDVIIDFDDDKNKKRMDNVWRIPSLKGNASENLDYPTQKPLALLERIIKASSNKGDIVMDPFCGCATALVAAEILGRQWVGIDGCDVKMHQLEKPRPKKESCETDYLLEEILFDRIAKDSDSEVFTGRDYKINPKMSGEFYNRNDLIPFNKKQIRTHLHLEQGKKCAGCEKVKEIEDMDLDHIIPRHRGGQDELRNLQMLCRNCNTQKGKQTETAWRRKVLQKRLDDSLFQESQKTQAKRAELNKGRFKVD